MDSDDSASIWNRACFPEGTNLRCGDKALAAMILAHSLTMNGGVLHAIECLEPARLAEAQSGYRFFSLDSVADLFTSAHREFAALGDFAKEEDLWAEYAALVPDDSYLVERFEEHLRQNPPDFALA